MGIPEYEAKRHEGRVKDGGILLSVHSDDSAWTKKAKEILERTGARKPQPTKTIRLAFAGMNVVSVLTLAEARFEIQMGRCGSLLMCHRLSSKQADDIAKLFRRYCPQGRIVFVTDGPDDASAAPEADAYVPESSGPQELLQVLRAA